MCVLVCYRLLPSWRRGQILQIQLFARQAKSDLNVDLQSGSIVIRQKLRPPCVIVMGKES